MGGAIGRAHSRDCPRQRRAVIPASALARRRESSHGRRRWLRVGCPLGAALGGHDEEGRAMVSDPEGLTPRHWPRRRRRLCLSQEPERASASAGDPRHPMTAHPQRAYGYVQGHRARRGGRRLQPPGGTSGSRGVQAWGSSLDRGRTMRAGSSGVVGICQAGHETPTGRRRRARPAPDHAGVVEIGGAGGLALDHDQRARPHRQRAGSRRSFPCSS